MTIFLLKMNEIFMERVDTVLSVSKETKLPSGFRRSFPLLASIHLFFLSLSPKQNYVGIFYTGSIPLAHIFNGSGQYGKSLHVSSSFYLNYKYLTNCFYPGGFQNTSDLKHSSLLKSC